MIKTKSNPIIIRSNELKLVSTSSIPFELENSQWCNHAAISCGLQRIEEIYNDKEDISEFEIKKDVKFSKNNNKNLILENSIFDSQDHSPPNNFLTKLKNRMKKQDL